MSEQNVADRLEECEEVVLLLEELKEKTIGDKQWHDFVVDMLTAYEWKQATLEQEFFNSPECKASEPDYTSVIPVETRLVFR